MKVMHEIQEDGDRYLFICYSDEGGIQDDVALACDMAHVSFDDMSFTAVGVRPMGEGLIPNQATIGTTQKPDLVKLRVYLSKHFAYVET